MGVKRKVDKDLKFLSRSALESPKIEWHKDNGHSNQSLYTIGVAIESFWAHKNFRLDPESLSSSVSIKDESLCSSILPSYNLNPWLANTEWLFKGTHFLSMIILVIWSISGSLICSRITAEA